MRNATFRLFTGRLNRVFWELVRKIAYLEGIRRSIDFPGKIPVNFTSQ